MNLTGSHDATDRQSRDRKDAKNIVGWRHGAGSWLRVELRSEGGRSVLVLDGALRDTSVTALHAQIDQLACMPGDDVVIDVSGLTALDAMGGEVLVTLSHAVAGRGGQLHVTGASDLVAESLRRSALELGGADETRHDSRTPRR